MKKSHTIVRLLLLVVVFWWAIDVASLLACYIVVGGEMKDWNSLGVICFGWSMTKDIMVIFLTIALSLILYRRPRFQLIIANICKDISDVLYMVAWYYKTEAGPRLSSRNFLPGSIIWLRK